MKFIIFITGEADDGKLVFNSFVTNFVIVNDILVYVSNVL